MIAELDLRLGLPCPFRAVTGLPCPFCGGTRAVDHALHLDASFLDYGAVWVFVLAGTLLAAAAYLLLRLADPDGAKRIYATAASLPARIVVPAIVLTVLVAWAWALAHADTIAP